MLTRVPMGYLRPQQVDALDGPSAWQKANGKVIYGTRPWKCFNEPGAGGTEVRYQSQDGALYSIPTKMPVNRLINLPLDMSREAATLLETGEELLVERSDQNFQSTVPEKIFENAIPVIKIAPPAAG